MYAIVGTLSLSPQFIGILNLPKTRPLHGAAFTVCSETARATPVNRKGGYRVQNFTFWAEYHAG